MNRKGQQDLGNLLKFLVEKGQLIFFVGLFLFKCYQRMGTYVLKITEVPTVHLLNMWSSKPGWWKRNYWIYLMISRVIVRFVNKCLYVKLCSIFHYRTLIFNNFYEKATFKPFKLKFCSNIFIILQLKGLSLSGHLDQWN